jgi:hypothetical protein
VVSGRPGPRSGAERRRDAEAILSTRHADCWIATASPTGNAHLVPLSLAWVGGHVVLITPEATATVRNLVAMRTARVAAGATRDVVMIDVVLETSAALADTAPDLLEAYAAQADWDPRTNPAGMVALVLRPERVQVWREADEIAGRTIMRDGRWLV